MTRPILHFAHANSFPADTYRQFFHHLREHYDVRALALHAHNPAYPVEQGWRALARELQDELAVRYDRPVILVGHSLGGLLCLMAAETRPDLVRCVVLLDSPLIAGPSAWALRIAKAFGCGDRLSPARLSARRRTTWPTLEAAYRHFAAKPVFSRWAPQVLRDYVEHALVAQKQGVVLRFDRETETAIYRTLPLDLGKYTKGFPVPVGFIGGSESLECKQAGLRATRRLVGPHFEQIQGGHLFPMEFPAPAARAVHRMIASLLRS